MAHTSGYAAPPNQWPEHQPPPGGAPPATPEQPPTIRQAVAAMWCGAVLSVLGGVLGFFMQDEIREEVDRQIERQGGASGLDPDTFVTIGLVAGAVGAVIGATLWIVHAVSAGKGKQWARISGTVLFAISVLFFLVSFAQPAPALSRLTGVLQQVVGLIAVVLLWLRPSTEFFQGHERARRGY